MAAFGEEDDERMCRYCFDDEEAGELISPCECRGGQRWVHLECLRRWQRMVLVSQPTHPMFHGDELRHTSCNVCKSEFRCAPPTRHELMTSFTGPEIAALIGKGCVVGAGAEFSVELAAQLDAMPPSLRESSSYEHWLRSAYLITGVDDDDGLLRYKAETEDELERLRDAVDRDTLVLAHRGKRLKLTPRGSLSEVEDLSEAFFGGKPAPLTVVFQEVDDSGEPMPRNCGDDHVSAVNLCRPMPRSWAADTPRAARALRRAYASIESERGKAWAQRCRDVEVVHHVGGPCDEQRVVRCLVLGGPSVGYDVVDDLADALFLASRRYRDANAKDNIGPGQRVVLDGLAKNPDLNGQPALVVKRCNDRWLVRVLTDSENRVVAARPQNLKVDAHPNTRYPASDPDLDAPWTAPYKGRVYAFWGDARWSRTQLLGEIARGHWGMCKASLTEIIANPNDRRPALEGRLVFAPISAMTEDSIARARKQMAPLRQQARLAAAAADDLQQDDDTPGSRRASSETAATTGPEDNN